MGLDFKNEGWGKTVLIRINTPKGTLWTLYAHLSQVLVKQGGTLNSGAVIGTTGISGNGLSNYPYLHFGLIPFVSFAEEVLKENRTA